MNLGHYQLHRNVLLFHNYRYYEYFHFFWDVRGFKVLKNSNAYL